jgi:hypothetical protein
VTTTLGWPANSLDHTNPSDKVELLHPLGLACKEGPPRPASPRKSGVSRESRRKRDRVSWRPGAFVYSWRGHVSSRVPLGHNSRTHQQLGQLSPSLLLTLTFFRPLLLLLLSSISSAFPGEAQTTGTATDARFAVPRHVMSSAAGSHALLMEVGEGFWKSHWSALVF